MKYITDLLNEVYSIDVISERYYFVGQVTISETDRIDHGIDKNSLREFKSKMFLTINKSNEADLKRLYNSAKTELTSLSKDQLINARKILLSYNYKHIFKKMGEFFVKVYEGKQHPADELEFRLFLNSNFICNIPENGDFSSYFLTNLIDEYSNKRGFIDLLIDDINNLLDDPQIQFNHKRHDIDTTLFKTIFKHCQDRDMFNIDEAEFLQRIARADLSGEIYNKGNKTKINIIIKMIGREKAICESWYTEAVDNLGITKNELTKAQDPKLEDEIKAIIDEWKKTKKEYRGKIKSNIKALNPT